MHNLYQPPSRPCSWSFLVTTYIPTKSNYYPDFIPLSVFKLLLILLALILNAICLFFGWKIMLTIWNAQIVH